MGLLIVNFIRNMNAAIARLCFTDEKEVISAFLEKRKSDCKEKLP
jgi:hypothetical protein